MEAFFCWNKKPFCASYATTPMNSRKALLAFIALPSFAQCFSSLEAATVSIHPTADTTLQEAYADYNYGDGTSFTAGGRRQGGRTRGLLLFDIAGNIPAGSTINSVSLTLTVTGDPSGGINSIFDLNRLTASWGEGNGSDHGGSPAGPGQATWNNRFG